MSRVVSLLLGAALLCGHGAFCRRVVSGESGATGRAGMWDPGGSRARAVRGSLSVQGGRSPRGVESCAGLGAGRRRGKLGCAVRSPLPLNIHAKS